MSLYSSSGEAVEKLLQSGKYDVYSQHDLQNAILYSKHPVCIVHVIVHNSRCLESMCKNRKILGPTKLDFCVITMDIPQKLPHFFHIPVNGIEFFHFI